MAAVARKVLPMAKNYSEVLRLSVNRSRGGIGSGGHRVHRRIESSQYLSIAAEQAEGWKFNARTGQYGFSNEDF